jgi:predicted nuclease of predicted toxin-antitoxin system
MTRLLLDQGIPLSAEEHLQTLGFDAIHVHNLGMSRATDRVILEYAKTDCRTVITLDADFHTILAVENESAPSVIRIRREGLRGNEIAQLLQRLWPLIRPKIENGAMATITEKTVRIRKLPLAAGR